MRLICKIFTKAYRDAMNAEINIPSDLKSEGKIRDVKNKLLKDVYKAQDVTDAQVGHIVDMAGDKELTGLKKRLYDSGVNQRFKDMADKSSKIVNQAIEEGKLNISDLPGHIDGLSNKESINEFSKGFLERDLRSNNLTVNNIGKPERESTGKTLDQIFKENAEKAKRELAESQKKKPMSFGKKALIGTSIAGIGALGYGLYRHNKNKNKK